VGPYDFYVEIQIGRKPRAVTMVQNPL